MDQHKKFNIDFVFVQYFVIWRKANSQRSFDAEGCWYSEAFWPAGCQLHIKNGCLSFAKVKVMAKLSSWVVAWGEILC